jgi:ribonuclease HI
MPKRITFKRPGLSSFVMVDGSFSPDSGVAGCAAVLAGGQRSVSQCLSNVVTSSSGAELRAILLGLEATSADVVYSDCLTVVRFINCRGGGRRRHRRRRLRRHRLQHTLVLRARQLLQEEGRILKWVPKRARVPEHVQADLQAKTWLHMT